MLLLIPPALAGGYLGVDYAPLGRADLVVAEEGQTSGTGLGEFDGLLQPPLTAWGGLLNGRRAWLLGLSVASERTSSYIGTESARSVRGAVRPSVDHRTYLRDRELHTPLPWIQVGLYGVIPWGWETSESYTTEEQAAMDTQAAIDRSRIGGAGLRMGGGVELGFQGGLFIGARSLLVIHQGRESDEDGITISTQLRTDVALTAGLQL